MQVRDKKGEWQVKFKFKFIPLSIFIAINIVVIMAMNFCAYTSCLHPTYHPNFSYFGLAFPVFLFLDFCFVLFWLVFKWKMVAIPIVGMLCCASSIFTYCPLNFKKSVPEGCIKVMSYNVCYFGKDKSERMNFETNAVAKYILDSGADIVCLQEGKVVGVKDKESAFSRIYPYMQEGVEDAHVNVCMSKYPIVGAEEINYESKTNRSFAYKILIGKDTVLVVNNHFESYKLQDDDKSEYKNIIKHPRDTSNVNNYRLLTHKLAAVNSIRGLQVDRVAEYVDSVPCKYKIVCGDFNDSPISYTHRRLTRNLTDAYTQSGFGPGISFHESGMFFRIDHILINDNIVSYQSKVDNSISESDHYPIISHLFLK